MKNTVAALMFKLRFAVNACLSEELKLERIPLKRFGKPQLSEGI